MAGKVGKSSPNRELAVNLMVDFVILIVGCRFIGRSQIAMKEGFLWPIRILARVGLTFSYIWG